jgi:hypothetical protein
MVAVALKRESRYRRLGAAVMTRRQQVTAAHNDLSVPRESSRTNALFILAVNVALIAGIAFMDWPSKTTVRA